MKTWKILDFGSVASNSPKAPIVCDCGVEANIPVHGLAIARVGMRGLVFDGDYDLPATIKCRSCGKVYTTERESNVR